MLFWLGLLVALIGGLLSIGFSREAIKLRFPGVGDQYLDSVAAILLVGGLIVSAVEHYRAKTAQERIEGDVAASRTSQVETEKALRDLSTFTTEQRSVNFDKAKEILQRGQKGSVEIAPLDGNVEASFLADELQLIFSRNGWKVSRRKAGTDEIVNAGIAVVTGSKSDGSDDQNGDLQLDEPANTLRKVLTTCISGVARGGSFRTYSRMPKDASVILIGPKY